MLVLWFLGISPRPPYRASLDRVQSKADDPDESRPSLGAKANDLLSQSERFPGWRQTILVKANDIFTLFSVRVVRFDQQDHFSILEIARFGLDRLLWPGSSALTHIVPALAQKIVGFRPEIGCFRPESSALRPKNRPLSTVCLGTVWTGF